MAITCGIKTIMRSRHILLMASGEEKAGIIKASILGPVTEDVPCSVLQLHPNVDYILDKTAAGMI